MSLESESEEEEAGNNQKNLRSPSRNSVKSLPDCVKLMDLPCMHISQNAPDPNSPFLCYLRLPRDLENFRVMSSEKETVMNAFDYLDARESLYSIRHSENIDYTRLIKNFYKEYNFACPDIFSKEKHILRFSSLHPGGNIQSAIKVNNQ